MRIIIRGAAEIEIILPAGVEPPTVRCPAAVAGNEAEQARSVAVPEPGGSASTFPGTDEERLSFARVFDRAEQQSSDGVEVRHTAARNMPGYEPGEDLSSAPSRLVGSLVREAAIVPCAGVTPSSEDTAPTVLDEPTVAALMAKVGDQVLAHVANPPPPVEPPAELALRRPVEADTLELPTFLDRRPVRAHG